MKKEKTYKTRIQDAEDFGLFFNCLTRRYLWDFDERLMELIIRILDSYLQYFSRRTIICSIQDFADCRGGIFGGTREEIPAEQKERYDFVLKQMVKRYLAIELEGSTDERWRRLKIHELASHGEFTGYHRNREKWMFPSKESFEAWVHENHLDEGEAVPLWEGELLPVKEGFLPDFASLCLAAEQYSYARFSYMPYVCREFIKKNIVLLTDEGLDKIAEDIEDSLREHPIYPDTGGADETKAWEEYAKWLRREQSSWEWKNKGPELMKKDYGQFEDEVHRMLMLPEDASEDDCAAVWSRMDGIYRYLMDAACVCPDKKERKRLVRWAKRYVEKLSWGIWVKANGWKYETAGPNLYLRRKPQGEADGNRMEEISICGI